VKEKFLIENLFTNAPSKSPHIMQLCQHKQSACYGFKLPWFYSSWTVTVEESFSN